jgi:general secretion pathway protein M
MTEWWQNCRPRERLILLAGAITVAAFVYYVALWQPAQQGVVDKQQRLAHLRDDAMWMEQAAEQYQKLSRDEASKPTGSANEALYALADRTARKAGLGDSIQGIAPESESQVRVKLRDADFDTLVTWLGRLRDDFRIHTPSVTIERTPASGRVNARLDLQRGER